MADAYRYRNTSIGAYIPEPDGVTEPGGFLRERRGILPDTAGEMFIFKMVGRPSWENKNNDPSTHTCINM